MKLASFDIFDTSLIRKCGSPENIFLLLAQYLYPDDKVRRDDFLIWRKQAEFEAYKRNKKDSVTLADIYTTPRLNFSMSDYTQSDLMKAEMFIESEQLFGYAKINELIEQKRREGFTVCFISDMYLPSIFLEKILRRENCLKDNEKVYVSCEEGARKSNGKLFDVIRNRLKPQIWQHYGDNLYSDVKIPRKKGIQASWVNTNFTEIESNFLKDSNFSSCPEALSLLVGFQRSARLFYGGKEIAELASDFVAPAYIPYLFFTLNLAQKRGIKKLYFLSRDSYILLNMAKEIESCYPNLQFCYLFVSRKSLLLPYLYLNMSAEQFLSVQSQTTILNQTVDELLYSLHTSREELENMGVIFEYKRINDILQEHDFLDKIFSDFSPYRLLLMKRAKTEYSLLCDYFKQEGLCEGVKSGMVDVGWLGSTRLMINKLLENINNTRVDFFYYGVRKDVMGIDKGEYISYLSPDQIDLKLTPVIENYYSASPFPSTSGYIKQNNGMIVPRFVNNETRKDTELTITNTKVVCQILHNIINTNFDFDLVYRQWMTITNERISKVSVHVPLRAFLYANDWDDHSALVRRFSSKQLFQYCLLGTRVTAFDNASLKLTVGERFYRLFSRMNKVAVKIRRWLFIQKFKLWA